MRSESSASTRRKVLGRTPACGLRLALLRTLLVHGARSNLLGFVLLVPSIEEGTPDVLVLPFTLLVPSLLRHDASRCRICVDEYPGSPGACRRAAAGTQERGERTLRS